MSFGEGEPGPGRRWEPGSARTAIDYEALVRNLEQNHFVYAHGIDGVFHYVSDSVERILGYSPSEFLHHYAAFQTDHPANRVVEERTAAALCGEKTLPYPVQVRAADGSLRWLEISENALLDASGRIVGIQGIAEDVTTRMDAEERLRESESRFRHAFHTRMLLATLTTLPDSVLVDANDAWLEFFGYKREDVLGRALHELPAFSDRAALERLVQRLNRTGSVPETEWVLPAADGPRTVLFSAERIEIQGRSHVLAVAKDITDRKRAEEALRVSEERLILAMEAGGMAAWDWHVPSGRIQYRRGVELLTRGEDIGAYSLIADLLETIHPEDRERLRAAIERTATQGIPFECDYRVRMLDGNYYWIHGKGSVYEWEDGKPLHVLGVSMDVSSRMSVEEERTHLLDEEKALRVEAERNARDREEFLSVAAHELRTPLAALTLQVEGLTRKLGQGGVDPETLGRNLEVANRQIQRLVRLVTSLLDLARLRRGRLELNCRLVDLVPVIAEVLKRFEPMLAKVDSFVTYAGDESLTGCWDAERLEQVLENLVSNAMKYGGGRPIEIEGSSSGSEVRIAVRDHGIGIPEKDAERIFEPYERAGAELHYGGLGMGLFITREIVEAHRGRITAERMGDGGALFTVVLPRSSD